MIGLVLATYRHWPIRLIESVESSRLSVHWFIHHHGADQDFKERIASLGTRSNVSLAMHGFNRGLARSWNDGIHEAYARQCEFAIVVNDDLFFNEGGFAEFISYVRAQSNYGIATVYGLETGGSPLAGQVVLQGLGCAVISPMLLARMGWFDQNFHPAYYEDNDFGHRMHSLDLRMIAPDRVLVEHARSTTTRENPEIANKLSEIMHLNRDYFERKWNIFDREPEKFGGEVPYRTPFNDPRFNFKIDWNDRDDPYPGYCQGLNDRSR